MDTIKPEIIERASEILQKSSEKVSFDQPSNKADINVNALGPSDKEKLSLLDKIKSSFNRYFRNIKDLRKAENKTSARNARNNMENINDILSTLGKSSQSVPIGNHINLGGMNFSGLPLCGMDFQGMSLEGADFRGAELDEANFCGAELAEADFSLSSLRNANFSAANLERTKFEGADLKGAKFMNANVYGADFSGTMLEFSMEAGQGKDTTSTIKESFDAINSAASEAISGSDGTDLLEGIMPQKEAGGLGNVLKQSFEQINNDISEMLSQEGIASMPDTENKKD